MCCCTAGRVSADVLKEPRAYFRSSSPNNAASRPQIYEYPTKEFYTDAVRILKVAEGHMKRADCQKV